MPPDASGAAASWFARASRDVAAATLGPHAEQVGRVEEVGDGVALVSGLPGVRLDEKLRFAGGQFGFAQVLERGRVGCVLLDDVDGVVAGDAVRGTGDVVRVPVGPACLGASWTRSAGRSTARAMSPRTPAADRTRGTVDHRP